ncbi:MAG: hypothetical protein K9J25_09645 [Bacteroidales bacterium]|nr:hypothetical protein [Bacteroidales bacterium]
MKHITIILATLLSFSTLAQIPEDFPYLEEDNIENVLKKPEKTFTTESLFGYMNGGAELYLEYGFDRLVVSEVMIDDSEYKVEVYRMNDPEAAFGIYSVSVFKCDTSNHIDDYSCQTPYQLQFCKGPYYVSIINPSGSSEAGMHSTKIASTLVDQIHERSFTVSDFLHGIPFKGEIIESTLIKGELGLSNGAYEWYDILANAQGYTGLIVKSQDEEVLSLRFQEQEDQNAFLKSLDILSQPPVNDELSIGEGSTLAVNYDNIIMIRRSR